MGARDVRSKDSMVRQSGISRDNVFTPADFDDLVRSTFIEEFEFHPEIDSTNARALCLARETSHRYPLLILAEHQTAGRGRGSNRWWGAPGALTFSLVLDHVTAQLPPRRWPQASLTTGLAVCEALEGLRLNRSIQLKWPNDVYLEGRKVCGVLLESPAEQPSILVLGIGLNVNNSLQNAPQELQSTAVTLADVAGRSCCLSDLLKRVLQCLAERLSWIGCRDDELWARYRERCLLTGRPICVELGQRSIRGLCRGIDEEGALVVETDEGIEKCFAGVVTQF